MNTILQPHALSLVMYDTYPGHFDTTRVQYLMEESLKMKRFSHPHVLGLIGVCVDAGPAPYIISPYMEHGSLLSYLRVERSVLVVKDDADAEEVKCVYFLYISCTHECLVWKITMYTCFRE